MKKRILSALLACALAFSCIAQTEAFAYQENGTDKVSAKEESAEHYEADAEILREIYAESEEGGGETKEEPVYKPKSITVKLKDNADIDLSTSVIDLLTTDAGKQLVVTVNYEAQAESGETLKKSVELTKEILEADPNKKLTFTVSDPEKLSVNADGAFTILGVTGDTPISVKVEYSEKQMVDGVETELSVDPFTCQVKISAPVTVDDPIALTLKIAGEETTDIVTNPLRLVKGGAGKKLAVTVVYRSGATKLLDPTALPEGTTLKFEALETTKVKVDQVGLVSPVATTGDTPTTVNVYYTETITANRETKEYPVSASVKVVVVVPVTGLTAKYKMTSIYPDKAVSTKTTIKNGAALDNWIADKITLSMTVKPTDATDKTLTYASSNTDCATVTAKGVVTVKNMGDTIITVTSVDNPNVTFAFSIHCYKNIINVVTDMGAVPGDGKTDYSAINNALAQAKYLIPGDKLTVNVPAGTFNIGGTLRAYSNTDLILDPAAIIQRFAANGNKHMLTNHIDQNVGGYKQIQNFNMSGGTWDGNSALTGAQTSDLIYIGHGQNITIQNTVIKNTCGEHLLELAGVNNATINNVELFGHKVPKSLTEYSGLKEAIQLDYCSSSSTPAMVPHDLTACKNITITNCNIHDYICGIGAHGAYPGIYLSNISIKNNTFTNISNICVDSRNFKKLTVKGNTATGMTEFLYATNSTGTIKSNTVKPKTFTKQLAKNYFYTANGIELITSNFTIQSNYITGMRANAVYVGTGSTATIKSNKLYKSTGYGIYSYGSTITLASNKFSKNTKGIYMTCNNVKIKSSDDIRSYYFDIEPEYLYTGKAIKPLKKIKNLKKKFYKVTYKNNKKKGTATITVKGKGKVKKSIKIKFKIVKKLSKTKTTTSTKKK